MMRIAADKAIFLLSWFLLVGILSLVSMEKMSVLKKEHFEKIDLNRAGLEDLMQIPRLSFKTAQSILEERNKRGRFTCLTDLESVSGVGPKTLEKLERFLCIGCR